MDEDIIAGAETAPSADEVVAEPRPPTGRRINSTLLIAVGILALVIVATAIVLFAGRGQAATYQAGSHEAALQNYLRAW